MIAPPPHHRNDDPVPKRPDAAPAGSEHFFIVPPAKNFKAQRWTNHPNDAINQCGNERNLDAAGPGKLREPGVVVNADFFVLLGVRRSRGRLVRGGLNYRIVRGTHLRVAAKGRPYSIKKSVADRFASST